MEAEGFSCTCRSGICSNKVYTLVFQRDVKSYSGVAFYVDDDCAKNKKVEFTHLASLTAAASLIISNPQRDASGHLSQAFAGPATGIDSNAAQPKLCIHQVIKPRGFSPSKHVARSTTTRRPATTPPGAGRRTGTPEVLSAASAAADGNVRVRYPSGVWKSTEHQNTKTLLFIVAVIYFLLHVDLPATLLFATETPQKYEAPPVRE